MESRQPDNGQPRRRQSIPLQEIYTTEAGRSEYPGSGFNTDATAPTASTDENAARTSSWYSARDVDVMDSQTRPESPIDFTALQMALPPDIQHAPANDTDTHHTRNPFDTAASYIEDVPDQYYAESDTAPLTAGVQPISGALGTEPGGSQSRQSFQTISDFSGSPSRGRATLRVDQGSRHDVASGRYRSHEMSLSPNNFPMSRSPSPSGAFLRAGSIVRAMSQRVVNISGESERVVNPRVSRESARSEHRIENGRDDMNISSMHIDTSYTPQATHPLGEKTPQQSYYEHGALPLPSAGHRAPEIGCTPAVRGAVSDSA